MCGKTLKSVQGFTDHVDKCIPEEGDQHTVIPIELVAELNEE